MTAEEGRAASPSSRCSRSLWRWARWSALRSLLGGTFFFRCALAALSGETCAGPEAAAGENNAGLGTVDACGGSGTDAEDKGAVLARAGAGLAAVSACVGSGSDAGDTGAVLARTDADLCEVSACVRLGTCCGTGSCELALAAAVDRVASSSYSGTDAGEKGTVLGA